MNLKIGQLEWRKKKSAHNQRVPWETIKQTSIVGIPGEETERGERGVRIFEETMTKNFSI